MRYVSLFAGGGGLDLGARAAGLEPMFVTDHDADCLATIAASSGTDGIDFVAADIEDMVNAHGFMGMAPDIVIGGPPCQGFSVAGQQNPADPRSELVFAFMDAVSQMRPTAFLMENVPALMSERWERVYTGIMRLGADLGYIMYGARMNAVDFGVPQKRERAFIFGMPLGTHPKYPHAQEHPKTVRECLTELPYSPGDVIPDAKITLARNPVLRKSPYAGMLVNGGGRVIDLDRPSPTITASIGGNRTHIIDLNALEWGTTRPWIAEYHSHLMHGRSPLREIPEWVKMRRLSMLECAALQGFPPGYPFQGSNASRWTQIGNAVPPPLAYVAVTALVNGLKG